MLMSDIRTIYAKKIDEVKNDRVFYLTRYSDEAFVEGLVQETAMSINLDMKKYLHLADTRIVGNFNNIRRDYKGDYADMVSRLDAGFEDKKTNHDRDFLTSWFWETFGTFGIGYNFSEELGEEMYIAEEEDAA